MESSPAHWIHPALKSLVAEASRSLARLDAARLEELALSCRALNRNLETADPSRRAELARQALDARSDMAVFGRVLEATRINLAVMNRIRALRARRRLEYRIEFSMNSGSTRSGYGNH